MKKTAYKVILRNGAGGNLGHLQAATVGLMRGCIDAEDAEVGKRIKALAEAYEETKNEILQRYLQGRNTDFDARTTCSRRECVTCCST